MSTVEQKVQRRAHLEGLATKDARIRTTLQVLDATLEIAEILTPYTPEERQRVIDAVKICLGIPR